MVNDAIEQMATSLNNIERYLAQQGGMTPGSEGGGTQNNFAGSQGVAARSGVLDPSKYVVRESDDLKNVDPGGAVTLSPGETKTIVDARPATDAGMALMAVGANDEPGVQYRLRVDDNRVIGGTTNSPLGVLNNPFSFKEKFGAVVPVESYVEYEVTYDATATGDVEIAGRIHVEML